MVERYGTETRLQENQLYTIALKVKGQELKVVSFTSRYNPLFSTVRMIRSDFRDLFSTYSDDDINRLIHDNSKLAIELTAQSANGTTIDVNAEDGIPYAARQYVRYKTELDLATDLFLTLSTKSGTEDKTLADMRIMKQVQLPYIDSILKVLQQRLASWEAQLIGMRAAPSSAVRAGGTAFPLNGRVNF